MTNRRLSFWLTGIIRVLFRTLWTPVYLLWLRLRVTIWGSAAFEYAVAHASSWLALAILKAYGAKIGQDIDFHGRLQLHGTYHMQGKLQIGTQCHIGPGVTLDLSSPIILEDRSTVALNSTILTHHDVGYSNLSIRAYPTKFAGVTVESDAFIGAGAIILAGVRVGRCSIVAAGAVVDEDVPPYTVVAGIPARQIKQIDPDQVNLT